MTEGLLALEDGRLFTGQLLGAQQTVTGEVVFNTAMTGYQEMLTDPSYSGQLLTLTTAHVGNTGTNDWDQESDKIHAAGLILGYSNPSPVDHWRQQQSLQDFLSQHHATALGGVDVRALTRHIREQGALRACIGPADQTQALVSKARQAPGLAGIDLAQQVTTQHAYHWQQGLWPGGNTSGEGLPVIVMDFGVKRNILRHLVAAGCQVTVVPATTDAQAILAQQPAGVVLSNGPGDPQPCDYAITTISHLLAAKMPLLGICLGHQLLALACGAHTVKMKFGHHGANHPIQCLQSQQVFITSQNHSFAVSEQHLPATLEITHRSLFDHTIQGLRHRHHPALSFQGHPEASPGPQDQQAIFGQFVHLMREHYAQT